MTVPAALLASTGGNRTLVPHPGVRRRGAGPPDRDDRPGRRGLGGVDHGTLAPVPVPGRPPQPVAALPRLRGHPRGHHGGGRLRTDRPGRRRRPVPSPYRPFWVGLGAVSFDLLLAVLVTSACATASAVARGGSSTGWPTCAGRSPWCTAWVPGPTPRSDPCWPSTPSAPSPSSPRWRGASSRPARSGTGSD